MNVRTVATTSIALLVLTISGCGSSSNLPDLDAGGDAKPASGATIKGAGYAFHVPTGWKQSTDKSAAPQVDTLAFGPAASGSATFRTNVNVVVKSGVAKGQPSDADYTKVEKQLVTALKGVGGSNLHVQPRLNLADETALHITGNGKQGNVEYQTNQYIAIHKGTEYVVTFSFPIGTQESDYLDVTEPTMASWSWS